MTVIAKIGALLFVIWGVLHVWVAYDGLETYYTVGVKSNWQHLIGGRLAPFSATPVVSEDPQTRRFKFRLFLNISPFPHVHHFFHLFYFKFFIFHSYVIYCYCLDTKHKPQVYALGGLIRNFVLDVGGYGVLGFFVAYKLWTEASWFAYWIGLVCIGYRLE